MRYPLLGTASAILVFSACKEASAPEAAPTFRLTATVSPSNTCQVTAMDKQYSSIGQIRGDVPTKFVGTLADKNYHGLGCWVATESGDGDLVVIFSGNNLGKPLAVGTYSLQRELYDETPPGVASVSFRPSDLGGDRLRTLDNAVGSVVVDSTASGARRISVDVQAARWGRGF